MDSAPENLVDELANWPSDADGQRSMPAYAGPVADYIAKLEARIDGLERTLAERLPAQPARIEAGPMAIDTRQGLSVSEVSELIRASRS